MALDTVHNYFKVFNYKASSDCVAFVECDCVAFIMSLQERPKLLKRLHENFTRPSRILGLGSRSYFQKLGKLLSNGIIAKLRRFVQPNSSWAGLGLHRHGNYVYSWFLKRNFHSKCVATV